LVILIMWPVNRHRKDKFYEEAKNYAVQRFGDRREPLSESERKLWYDFMEVKEGEEPKLNQLRNYIEFIRYEKNQK
jgi:hypothetical protein